MDILAYHLPAGVASDDRIIVNRHRGVCAVAPALTAEHVGDICRRLLEARPALAAMSTARVIAAIDAAARGLLDPNEPEREVALQSLELLSGYSAAMAVEVLDRAAQDWQCPALEQLVHLELGGPECLDGFSRRSDGSRVRAVAPPLGLHLFSGNVAGVSVTSVVRALLVRSAVLGKTAAGEPALAACFARLLTRADPDIGRCVAITYWPGGDEEREAAALVHAGLVVHYGAAASIASLRARTPAHVRFIEHGPRISFAVIRATGLDAQALAAVARDLARAVALFDQQGCVSPQLAYVIGTTDDAQQLAGNVAAELAVLARKLPRGRIEPAEAMAVHELRARAEFSQLGGSDTRIWSGDALGYTVLCSGDPQFEGTCLNRTLLVKAVLDEDAVVNALDGVGQYLQSVGIAGFGDVDAERFATRLASAGATRITTIARMPWPPPAWHHDGRGPLRELLRFVDLDR